MDRPALQQLLADIAAGWVGTVVVYKIDRLTRSLTEQGINSAEQRSTTEGEGPVKRLHHGQI